MVKHQLNIYFFQWRRENFPSNLNTHWKVIEPTGTNERWAILKEGAQKSPEH